MFGLLYIRTFSVILAENGEFQKVVQIQVNNFQMKSKWISSIPMVAFALIAGSLSDRLGRKPPLLFPLFGYLISSVINVINYAFIETLPVEFLYLSRIGSFFGGYVV
jgi:MFS family permease